MFFNMLLITLIFIILIQYINCIVVDRNDLKDLHESCANWAAIGDLIYIYIKLISYSYIIILNFFY
jgi:hypothetical protein